jgi:hypothetical protein
MMLSEIKNSTQLNLAPISNEITADFDDFTKAELSFFFLKIYQLISKITYIINFAI